VGNRSGFGWHMGTLALRKCVHAAGAVCDYWIEDAEANLVNGHDPRHHTGFASAWSDALLSIQHRLGILAQWRTWIGITHHNHSAVGWPSLIDIIPFLHGRRKREDRISQ
jgi:hypothetical protein